MRMPYNIPTIPNRYPLDKNDKLGLLIGTLLSGGLAAAGSNNTEESPWLRGVAGATAGFGAGGKALNDSYSAMIDDYLKNEAMDFRNKQFGQQVREYEETDKPYKQAVSEYFGKKETYPSGMGRMNEYSAFQRMSPEEQTEYLNYLSKTGYNRVLGMDETGNPIFVPTRGNVQLKTPANTANTGTVAPAVSGKDMQPFVKPALPTSEIVDTADFKTLLDLSKQVKDTYSPEYSGTIQGRLSKVKENWTGGLPDKQLKFNQALESIKNRLIYLRSGKQINEQEFKRMMQELPDVKLPDNTSKIRLDNFYQMEEDLYNNRMKALGVAGYRKVDNIQRDLSTSQPQTADDFMKLLEGK